MNSPFPKTLIREIADRRAVFFIGSGVSKAARPALPTWAGLLKNLAKDLPKKVDQTLVTKLITQGHLLDAAQVICDGLPTPDLHERLREIFQFSIPNHSLLYQDLVAIDPKVIVTTNYDEILEKALEHFGTADAYHTVQHIDKNALNYIRSPMRSIFKFHGTITDVPNIVLTRTSYFSARRDNPGFYALMSALMTVHTVVFFGYGLSDPDIQLILENINSVNTSDHPHYVISSKLDSRSLKSAYESTYNIKIIEYDKSDHTKMLSLLTKMKEEVETVRLSRGIV